MLAFTTLFLSVPIVILLYFFVFKKIKIAVINYFIVLAVSVLFFFGRNLHLIFIGIQIFIIGFIVVFVREKFHQKAKQAD